MRVPGYDPSAKETKVKLNYQYNICTGTSMSV